MLHLVDWVRCLHSKFSSIRLRQLLSRGAGVVFECPSGRSTTSRIEGNGFELVNRQNSATLSRVRSRVRWVRGQLRGCLRVQFCLFVLLRISCTLSGLEYFPCSWLIYDIKGSARSWIFSNSLVSSGHYLPARIAYLHSGRTQRLAAEDSGFFSSSSGVSKQTAFLLLSSFFFFRR
ncbi:hypothetical protein FA15DRAFT_164331 [Coprinopsis marcescibilis]|uniref:Uncharacterized protein n=1 Tax=Coprinopsis marcescibilis TaxID=230819 RepID=A0A5C3KI42_COPMA|nr:hypothetical protein FA15DRAFT_164331 [Coprinopsis marcescibilis]